SAGSATLTTKQSSAASSSASMIFRPPSLLSSTPGMRAPNPSSGLQPCSPSRKNSPGVAERSSRSSPAAPARNPENGGKRLYSYFADTTLVAVLVGLRGADWHYAAGAGHHATHVLELHSAMVDAKALAEDSVHAAENTVAARGRHILNHNVAAQGVRMRTKTPHVQIVHAEDAVHLADRVDHGGQFHAARQALQQNIQRFPRDVPGGPDDQHGHGDGKGGVDLTPAEA